MTEDDIRTELPAHATPSRRAAAQPSPEAAGSAPVASTGASTGASAGATPNADPYSVTLPKSGRTVKVRQIDGDTATRIESLMVDAEYKGNNAMLRCISAASIASIDGAPESVAELKVKLAMIHRVDWEPIMRRVAALDGLAEDPDLPATFHPES